MQCNVLEFKSTHRCNNQYRRCRLWPLDVLTLDHPLVLSIQRFECNHFCTISIFQQMETELDLSGRSHLWFSTPLSRQSCKDRTASGREWLGCKAGASRPRQSVCSLILMQVLRVSVSYRISMPPFGETAVKKKMGFYPRELKTWLREENMILEILIAPHKQSYISFLRCSNNFHRGCSRRM